MTTDRDIPERWREHYDFLNQATDNCLDVQEGKELIEALGTAESLVRDLALALDAACFLSFEYKECLAAKTVARYRELLSRIPAHLRAPETTHKESR